MAKSRFRATVEQLFDTVKVIGVKADDRGALVPVVSAVFNGKRIQRTIWRTALLDGEWVTWFEKGSHHEPVHMGWYTNRHKLWYQKLVKASVPGFKAGIENLKKTNSWKDKKREGAKKIIRRNLDDAISRALNNTHVKSGGLTEFDVLEIVTSVLEEAKTKALVET